MFAFVRPSNGRCPACDLLGRIESRFRKRFLGSFDALGKTGASYHNEQRFKALHGDGKPLWEFKEHDHRLYCYRKPRGDSVDVVLLDGWIKDKKGKTEMENSRITAAQNLRSEFIAELRDARFDDLLEAN